MNAPTYPDADHSEPRSAKPSRAPAPPLCMTTWWSGPLMLFATPLRPARSSEPISVSIVLPWPTSPSSATSTISIGNSASTA